jgi:hypothetical protein
VQRLQLGSRGKPKVIGEASDEFAIGVSCTRTLPAACKPAHVRTQRGLVEWVCFEEPRR